jgi:hypothetical protein
LRNLKEIAMMTSITVDPKIYTPEQWSLVREVMDGPRGRNSHYFKSCSDDGLTFTFTNADAARRFSLKIKILLTQLLEKQQAEAETAKSLFGTVGHHEIAHVVPKGTIEVHLPKGDKFAEAFLAELNKK